MENQKTITLRAKHRHWFGVKMNFPIVGDVTLSPDGEVEVPEEVGRLILGQPNDWEQIDLEEEELEEENENEEEEEIEDGLEKLSMEEMIDIAKKAKIKGYNLFKDEKNMRAFLRKKIAEGEKKAAGKATGK